MRDFLNKIDNLPRPLNYFVNGIIAVICVSAMVAVSLGSAFFVCYAIGYLVHLLGANKPLFTGMFPFFLDASDGSLFFLSLGISYLCPVVFLFGILCFVGKVITATEE